MPWFSEVTSSSVPLSCRTDAPVRLYTSRGLGGDFNVEPGDSIFMPLEKFMHSARCEALKSDDKGTFNNFGKMTRKCILDHLFYRGRRVECLEYTTLDGNYGAPFISDHYPIEAMYRLK